MSILKNKIAACLRLYGKNNQKTQQTASKPGTPSKSKKQKLKKCKEMQYPNTSFTSPESPSRRMKVRNNVTKNYSRALTSFALSDLALPYLLKALEINQLDLKVFQDFIRSKKEKIN